MMISQTNSSRLLNIDQQSYTIFLFRNTNDLPISVEEVGKQSFGMNVWCKHNYKGLTYTQDWEQHETIPHQAPTPGWG